MSLILLQDLTSSPLRLITSAAKLNIVIKKKIEDCSVVAARLHAICDDILWVLTHAQLQAVASFAKSVVQVVEKCKKSEPAPSVVSLLLPLFTRVCPIRNLLNLFNDFLHIQ